MSSKTKHPFVFVLLILALACSPQEKESLEKITIPVENYDFIDQVYLALIELGAFSKEKESLKSSFLRKKIYFLEKSTSIHEEFPFFEWIGTYDPNSKLFKALVTLQSEKQALLDYFLKSNPLHENYVAPPQKASSLKELPILPAYPKFLCPLTDSLHIQYCSFLNSWSDFLRFKYSIGPERSFPVNVHLSTKVLDPKETTVLGTYALPLHFKNQFHFHTREEVYRKSLWQKISRDLK